MSNTADQEAIANAAVTGGGISIENYSIWFRSIRLSLLGRNKLGLVDDSCKKEDFPKAMGNHWERVNAIVLSWIMCSIEKGLLGGIMYATNAQAAWEEFHERFNKIDGSRTFDVHKEISTLSLSLSFHHSTSCPYFISQLHG
ncbi:uncharacterized protein [Nicotiana tomentosiformis]|uniref:uncharacterized protein n=1 Tax=Nicotiana tomentosiformis TaxID=4098 RepID=UPI00388C46B9